MRFRRKYIEAGLTKDPCARDAYLGMWLPFRRHLSINVTWCNGREMQELMRDGFVEVDRP